MRYFVCADPHGFYSIMRRALEDAGFNPETKGHRLIICGDIFDRGDEPIEMYHYLKFLGDKFIFVKGNHEDLFEECLREYRVFGRVGLHHEHNGTLATVKTFEEAGLSDEVRDWIFHKAVNYYETKNYVFVHGWLPGKGLDDYPESTWHYLESWREANERTWRNVRWRNGMSAWSNDNHGESLKKTIVCGHWHCGYGNIVFHKEHDLFDNFKMQEVLSSDHPFVDNNIIALDTCTVYNRKVNVIEIKDALK